MLDRADRCFGGLALVKTVAAKILDDQADIIRCGEGFGKNLQQNVGAFAENGAADKQKFEFLPRLQGQRFDAGPEFLCVHAVRDDAHFFRRDAGIEIHVPHQRRRHPELIHVRRLFDPGLRQRAVFPRLNNNQQTAFRPRPVRRPLMTHGHGGFDGGLGGKGLRATLHGRIGFRAPAQTIRADTRQIQCQREARGEFAVDVRQAAVIEKRAFPRDEGPGIFWRLGTGNFGNARIKGAAEFVQ